MAAYKEQEDVPTPLGRLLIEVTPPNEYGRKTFTHLATLVPVSRTALQKWLDNQRVPARRVARLVEIGKMRGPGKQKAKTSRVRQSDFDDFVYNFPD